MLDKVDSVDSNSRFLVKEATRTAKTAADVQNLNLGAHWDLAHELVHTVMSGGMEGVEIGEILEGVAVLFLLDLIDAFLEAFGIWLAVDIESGIPGVVLACV